MSDLSANDEVVPVNFKDVIGAIVASLVLLSIGGLLGFFVDGIGGWAGLVAAAAGSIALAQFLVTHWTSVVEKDAPKKQRGAVYRKHAELQGLAQVIWYIALVVLVISTGIVAGAGFHPSDS